MEIVSIGEPPAQPPRKQVADRRLACSDNAHENQDHLPTNNNMH
jgi:hypothetical protein